MPELVIGAYFVVSPKKLERRKEEFGRVNRLLRERNLLSDTANLFVLVESRIIGLCGQI
jgi:hypothetical protein